MPVTPYPRVDRALHQVNRHEIEKVPGEDRIPSEMSERITKAFAGLSGRGVSFFLPFPGPRKPSDG